MFQAMNGEPRTPPEPSKEVVKYWLSTLPSWDYTNRATFYEALIFMRMRMIAMDRAQNEVSSWLMKRDESVLGPLKRLLAEFGELTNQADFRLIYDNIEDVLRSRLLRSRSDGRALTYDALNKLQVQLHLLEKNLSVKQLPDLETKQGELQLIMKRIAVLVETLKEEDFLYDTFEPARSILNAFKQQKSAVSEILNWYKIPNTEKELEVALKKDKEIRKDVSPSSTIKKLVESEQELFCLDASSKKSMTEALRQAYFLFFQKHTGVPMHIGNLISIDSVDWRLSKIGTKGHEWEAFTSSAFNLEEPLFKTVRNIDKNARTFEVKLAERLAALEKSLQHSAGKVEALLLDSINSAKADLQLKLKNDVQYEITIEPRPGVFQRITYQMPAIFRTQIEDLCIDLSVQIYKQFDTKEFKVSIESLDSSVVQILLDFPSDLGAKRTDISRYVSGELQKLKVNLDLKFNR